MTAVRIWFEGNEVLVDTVPLALVAGAYTASIDGSGVVRISRIASDFAVAAVAWADVADASGQTFATADAAMAYLSAQLSMRRSVGGAISLRAGADLGGHRALMLSADGTAVHADPTADDYAFAGVSLGATLAIGTTTLSAAVSGLLRSDTPMIAFATSLPTGVDVRTAYPDPSRDGWLLLQVAILTALIALAATSSIPFTLIGVR